MDLSKDIRSLSDFKRNTGELMARMTESGEPMVLTVNGKAKLVVQDAVSYQKLLESIDYSEAVKGIRRGMDDVTHGRSKPAARAFAEIRKKHGIPRSLRPVKYRVEVTAGAQAEADAAYQRLADRTVHAAAWLNGLEQAIAGLCEFPNRCGTARESREFDEPVRQLLYGKSPHVYRVLFIVRSDVVYVLHVRHAARRALGRDDVMFPPEGETPR